MFTELNISPVKRYCGHEFFNLEIVGKPEVVT